VVVVGDDDAYCTRTTAAGLPAHFRNFRTYVRKVHTPHLGTSQPIVRR
jgi:hypothetical protein